MKLTLRTLSTIATVIALLLSMSSASGTYDPVLGRWLTRDPGGERSDANLYRFNYNSPLNYVDPDGRNPLLVLFLAGAAIGGVMTPAIANAPGPGDTTYPALSGEAILGNALGGGLFNVALGGAGMLTDGTLPTIRPSPCAVSRWGRPGLQPRDWVMPGDANWWNYLMSGKYQPPWMLGDNMPAPFSAGETFMVSPEALQWPSELGFPKGFLGQRIYTGPAIPSTGSTVNAPPTGISFPR